MSAITTANGAGPETDPRALFEKLVLDGFQAGLAWITILRKREAFRAAFEGFEPERIARCGEADVARLLAEPGIVRSRAKIEATIGNARAWLEIEAREGFDAVHLAVLRLPARGRTAGPGGARYRPRRPRAARCRRR